MVDHIHHDSGRQETIKDTGGHLSQTWVPLKGKRKLGEEREKRGGERALEAENPVTKTSSLKRVCCLWGTEFVLELEHNLSEDCRERWGCRHWDQIMKQSVSCVEIISTVVKNLGPPGVPVSTLPFLAHWSWSSCLTSLIHRFLF